MKCVNCVLLCTTIIVYVVVGIREVIRLVLIVAPQTAELFLLSCLTSFGTLMSLRSNNSSAPCSSLRIVPFSVSQCLYIFTQNFCGLFPLEEPMFYISLVPLSLLIDTS